MNIPSDAIIPSAKLNRYLLVKQVRNDKSKFLAKAGFALNNYTDLEKALRELVLTTEATEDRAREYGTYYQVTGLLKGLNGIDLDVITIWLERKIDKQFQFVTLLPNKKNLEKVN